VEVVRLDNAGITYDGQRWVLRGLDLTIARGEKTALVGYNGLGKTTLLRMIAGALAPSEGRRVLGHRVVVGYQSQDFAETMDPDRTVFDTVKSVAGDLTEQGVRTQLGGFGFSGDAIEKHVDVLSGGEKIRLAFARLLVQPCNLLILDEPTTHLDIQACEALEEALSLYSGTLCFVSHDTDFVRKVATGIIAMTPPGVTRYPGGYDYYHEKVISDQSSVISVQKSEVRGQKSAANSTPDTRHATPDTRSTVDKKELRKQRAAERQALYDQTKDLKKDLRRAEQQVAALEPERAKVLEELSNPALVKDFMALNRKLLHIEEDIQRYTELWEKAAMELEKIEGKAKE
jgi:ATP-binding cassette subfamily F protein 3